MKKRNVNIIICLVLLSMSCWPISVKANSSLLQPSLDAKIVQYADNDSVNLRNSELIIHSHPGKPDASYEELNFQMKNFEKEKVFQEYMNDLEFVHSIKSFTKPSEKEFKPPTDEVIAETQAKVRSFDCSIITDVPETECEALVALYESTNGAGWVDNTNWLSTSTVGNWHGIRVDLYFNSVEAITLEVNNLTGTIPSEIGNLINLEYITLVDNNLTGSIPASFGNLQNLWYLYLPGNDLTGQIPSSLGNLQNLEWLYLSQNQLSGEIPSTIGALSKLEVLRLGENQLTGSIPPELGNLHNLRDLYIEDNSLSGEIPSSLGNLTSLEILYLSWNQLGGVIPSELGNLNNLEQLHLSGNLLEGNIPASLGNLKKLRYFYLSSNQLEGSVPSTLGNLTSVESFSIARNSLIGSIPLSFVNLINLKYMAFSNTFICEPNTQEFITWKATVDQWYGTGIICTEIELTGIEITQVIQNLYNDVFLIEDKPTYVRAHVKSYSGTIKNVVAELIVKRPDGTLLGTLLPSNQGMSIDIYENARRDFLNDSFLFYLPKSWCSGDIQLEVKLIGHDLICRDRANTDFDCKAQVTFQSSPPIEITFIGIIWIDENGVMHAPTMNDIYEAKQQILDTYPISKINWNYPYNILWRGNDWNAFTLSFLNYRLGVQRLLDGCGSGCENVYLGVIVDPPIEEDCYLGIGSSGSRTASGFIYSNVIPHELAHVFQREHTTGCGAKSPFWWNYPYPNGYISPIKDGDPAFYGFNSTNKNIFNSQSSDLMTYCYSSMWPSDFTYEGLHNKIFERYNFSSNQTYLNSRQVNNYILIGGQILSSENVGNIEDIYEFESSSIFPTNTNGDYFIKFLDQIGDEIATFPFSIEESTQCPPFCEGEDLLNNFTIAVPYLPDVLEIQLLHNEEILDTRTASINQPSVQIVYPNGGEVINDEVEILWDANDYDGDSLLFAVQYSSDGGLNWETLASGLESNSLTINSITLAGSNNALIRVLASDGFYTAADMSNETFSIGNHFPGVVIKTPKDNDFFVADQTIVFEGEAFDNEDGYLLSESLTWSSSVDGVLGKGSSLIINAMNMNEGSHTITLSGQDSAGQTGEEIINLIIHRDKPTLPISLSVAPNPVYFSAYKESGLTEEREISIRNDGDGDMPWSVEADQNWIIISELSGTAPSEINISADTTGLAVGEYEATITITASSATNSPQDIKVYMSLVEDVNNPPGITSTPVTVAVQDELYTYNITATDPDDGDTLSITATTKPGWLTFTDYGDGTATLSGTPSVAEVGDHDVALYVEDSGGLTDTQEFSIEVEETINGIFLPLIMF